MRPRLYSGTVDMEIGLTTAYLRQMGGLKHGFPQTGNYTLTWWLSRTKQQTASMVCRVTPDAAICSYSLKSNTGYIPVSLTIPFTWTACNYGGRRTWFLCRCGRRVGKILFRGEQFGCRHCFNVTYQSCRDCQIGRAWGQIYKTGKRLKLAEPMEAEPSFHLPPRPKSMNRKRHRKLCRDLQQWHYRKNTAIVEYFNRTNPGLIERLQKK